jgi:hypothetical protein
VTREPDVAPRVRAVTYRVFERLSAARGRRIFHPRGELYRASFAAREDGAALDAELLEAGSAHPAVVRFSRGIGVPPPLPDVLGVAIRLPSVYGDDRHQDFLLASAGTGVAKALPVAARTFFGPAFSSLLPYAIGRERLLVGALAESHATPRSRGNPLDELAAAVGRRSARFVLAVGGLRTPWRPVALVEILEPLPHALSAELRFNPWNTGAGIEPVGFPNRIRAPAYRGSQAGRPTSPPPRA